MNSEQDERAAMIEAARASVSPFQFKSKAFGNHHSDLQSIAVSLMADFALAQTADLREQLRVAREAIDVLRRRLRAC